MFHDGYNITYVLQNDIQGGTLDKLNYNVNNDLSQSLRKLSVRLIVSSFIHTNFENKMLRPGPLK